MGERDPTKLADAFQEHLNKIGGKGTLACESELEAHLVAQALKAAGWVAVVTEGLVVDPKSTHAAHCVKAMRPKPPAAPKAVSPKHRARGLVPTKRCSTCKCSHALSAFGPDRSRKDGLSTRCAESRRVRPRCVERSSERPEARHV